MSKDKYVSILKILSEPYQDDNGKWCLDVIWGVDSSTGTTTITADNMEFLEQIEERDHTFI